jgi:hypothetical protein
MKQIWKLSTASISAFSIIKSAKCLLCAVFCTRSIQQHKEPQKFDLLLIFTLESCWKRILSLRILSTEQPRSATTSSKRNFTHGISATSSLIQLESSPWGKMKPNRIHLKHLTRNFRLVIRSFVTKAKNKYLWN